MNSKPVYSTEGGRVCQRCGRYELVCVCKRGSTSSAAPARNVPKDGVVRVGVETKGRKGKGVTVVSGVRLDPVALAELAKELKVQCGSGGTSKDGVIEIQGDHRDKLLVLLGERGFKAKKAGG